MAGLNGSKGFKDLLTEWLDLQSTLIIVSVSAGKYKISSVEKDTEKFLHEGSKDDLVTELRNLSTRIKDVNRSYFTGDLSPTKVATMTKIQILHKLDYKAREIDQLIRMSSVSSLYKILNLSSEYISTISKKRLRNLAQVEIDNVYKEFPSLSFTVGDKRQVTDRWKIIIREKLDT